VGKYFPSSEAGLLAAHVFVGMHFNQLNLPAIVLHNIFVKMLRDGLEILIICDGKLT
jgi:hypothetical protein